MRSISLKINALCTFAAILSQGLGAKVCMHRIGRFFLKLPETRSVLPENTRFYTSGAYFMAYPVRRHSGNHNNQTSLPCGQAGYSSAPPFC
jgi:hypothetical protein